MWGIESMSTQIQIWSAVMKSVVWECKQLNKQSSHPLTAGTQESQNASCIKKTMNMSGWLQSVWLNTLKRDDSRGTNHEMKTRVWKHDDRVGDKEANFTLRYDLGGKFYFGYFFSWTSNCWINHVHPQWKETRGFSFKINNKVMKL